MKANFVADGHARLLRGRKVLTTESIEKKYAQKLAASSPIQKAQIQEQIKKEFLRQQSHKPSPGTLW